MTDSIHVHFMADVRGYDAAYECLRCGETTTTARQMYAHRRGLLSECDRARLAAWVRDLLGRGEWR